ncbi:DciA family protein [Granulicella sp. dw_53]|uniref:DciA family protein n=1 Tax=Granulicella sp. dw_53 TaxID=2719792 RepID=UPI002107562F|nr:DciA family protein [Granulicella sp. dw_53]
MRGLLRGSLGRSLEALEAIDRLAAAWPVACGSAMAGHGEVVGYEDGLVRIMVTDAAWLQQMRSMSEVLRRELAKIAAVAVTGIHFEVKSFARQNAEAGRSGPA